MLAIHLRDISPGVVAAWEVAFASALGVQVSCGDIFANAADAIVSPANSFGYMDGGIDLVYSRFFGWELQEKLQAQLLAEHFGELPVGQAVIVPTGHASIPFLVSAPTMRVPSSIAKTLNVYLAFRAALIAVRNHNATSERSTPFWCRAWALALARFRQSVPLGKCGALTTSLFKMTVGEGAMWGQSGASTRAPGASFLATMMP